MPFQVQATGTVESMRSAAVISQVGGLLLHVRFREGDEVAQGQVLFEIDPRPFAAAEQLAEANLSRDLAQADAAVRDAARYEALVKDRSVTEEDYQAKQATADALTATVRADSAALTMARLNLGYATIRAPIAGRTGSLRVREGNLVRSTDTAPLVTINQIEPILVRFAVPAGNLPAIQRYRPAGIAVIAQPGNGGSASEGTLAFIDNAVDTATGTILLKGSFANSGGALWPGEFVNVRLRLFVDQGALVVPASAIVAGQQGSLVFVIQPDGTAATKPVKVDRTAGDIVIVSGDIKPGDRVVTDGQLRLRQGSRVQIKARGDSTRAGAS